MSLVTANVRVSDEFFMLTVSERSDARAGQFCMLRAWGGYPLLSRPISICDRGHHSLSFLFRVVGRGTYLLSKLRAGDELEVGRVLGNGYPNVDGKVALVGGGTGIAPIYLASKQFSGADAYIGFSAEPMLTDKFEASVSGTLTVDVGGFITDKIDPSGYDAVMACGPEPMLKALHNKCSAAGVPLYISLERRMGCGTGLCYGCSVETTDGMKKVCHDGPVFDSREIYELQAR